MAKRGRPKKGVAEEAREVVDAPEGAVVEIENDIDAVAEKVAELTEAEQPEVAAFVPKTAAQMVDEELAAATEDELDAQALREREEEVTWLLPHDHVPLCYDGGSGAPIYQKMPGRLRLLFCRECGAAYWEREPGPDMT